MGETQLIAEPGIPQVKMIREFDAPPELLFRAYTEPELLKQWLGPRRLGMDVERSTSATAASGATRTATTTARTGSAASSTARRRSRTASCRRGSTRARPATSTSRSRSSRRPPAARRLVLNAVYPSVETRDAEFAAGMESGARESLDRLDELVASQQPA